MANRRGRGGRTNIKRDSDGKFARTGSAIRQGRGALRQKRATRRAGRITKASNGVDRHYAKYRLSSERFGDTAHSQYHLDRMEAHGGKLQRARLKQRAQGFDNKGKRIGPPIGKRKVRKLRKRAKESAKARQWAKYKRNAKK